MSKILKEFGYKIDCSITPFVNWSENNSQYKKFQERKLIKNEVFRKTIIYVLTNVHNAMFAQFLL